MRQLTKETLLETNKARAESPAPLHFQLKSSGGITLPELNEQGAAKEPNQPGIIWVRFQREKDKSDSQS